MTTTTVHEYAVEVDTRLADAHKARATADRNLGYAADALRRAVGQRYDYRTRTWNGTLADAVTAADDTRRANALDDFEIARVVYGATVAEVERLNRLYTGWSRFFLVTNTNGHIHSSMECTTCYPTTEFAWLPTLSGLTEADAVAAQGEILCSVCFPSAPVAWTTGVAKATQVARDERDAKKAAAAAKKAEKALGTVLRVGRYKDRIETIATAKRWLTDAAEWNNEFPADVELVAETLAARVGTTAAAELAAAAQRAARRR